MTDPEAPPVEPAPPVEDEPLVDDPTTEVNEAAPDAELRAWAAENGIEGVPASGKLSAQWRTDILAAMEAAAAEVPPAPDPEPEPEEEPVAEELVVEYRSVFQPPDTWVSSQTFTA